MSKFFRNTILLSIVLISLLMPLGLSVLVLVYFFFEINAIDKVHDYYLFLFYPLLFSLVAYGAYHLLATINSH